MPSGSGKAAPIISAGCIAAGDPEDLRACDRAGIVCTQPAGDKEKETFGRQWRQRTEVMRNILIAYRNHPSILFWEAGNNAISAGHMREMRRLKEELDPRGGRRMGCRTINTEDVLAESEYVGTMLNRHAARFLAEHGPDHGTEYSREEAPRRVWDDYTPPDFDYRNRYLGKGGRKQKGLDFYDLTSEDLALANAGDTASSSLTVSAARRGKTCTAPAPPCAGRIRRSTGARAGARTGG